MTQAVSSIDDFGGEGFWSVGTVETLTPDGAVGDVRVVCTATGQSAAEVSGPTDGALSGTWKCECVFPRMIKKVWDVSRDLTLSSSTCVSGNMARFQWQILDYLINHV